MGGGPEMMAAQAAQSFIQGIGQRSELRAEARALDENARITETQGAYDAVDALRASRAAMGEDIAGAAASGSGLGGSVADMLRAKAVENQMEAMSIRATAGSRADGLRSEAKAKRRQGGWALMMGAMSAGAAVIKATSQSGANRRLDDTRARDRASRFPQPTGSIPLPPREGGSGVPSSY